MGKTAGTCQVSIRGKDDLRYFSKGISGNRDIAGAPLVYFEMSRKLVLTGHVPGVSATYGDVAGGAKLVLTGSNFAPLGENLQ